MNFRDRIPPQKTDFQIAPMIDVVFLLLIFFIVTLKFATFENDLKVSVPAAREGAQSERSIGEIVVNVRDDGSIVLNRAVISEEELRDKLARIAKKYKDQAVILRGDGEASYTSIIRVLDICQAASIWNVAFATTTPRKKIDE